MSSEPTVKFVVGERYEFQKELGSGGFGTVFLARDLKFPDKQVAVKMMHAASAEARNELWEEIRHLSQIDDPYVLRTTDWGHHGDSIFMVTEYVKGKTLTMLTDEHRQLHAASGPTGFDPLFAANVGFWIARSLIAVHAARVVHRDLTPNNVMIELQGTGHMATIHAVKLIDFGLASQRGVTIEEARGTPHYVAPEVLRHQPVSPNTDIYSLGCILFEMVMGEPPYGGNDTQAVVDQHCSPAAPPRMRSGSSDFDELVERMMSKDPVQRADSTARVADGLSRIAAEIQRSRTIPRAVSPQLPTEAAITHKLPAPSTPASNVTDLITPPTSAQLAAAIQPKWRRPVMAIALLSLLIGVVMVLLSSPEPTVQRPPLVASATPPPALKPVPQVEPPVEPPPPEAPTGPDELTPITQRPKPVPKPVPNTPRATCEPTADWKRMMLGNLEALEAGNNMMTNAEVQAESARVGKLVEAASTSKDCGRAIAEFEALKVRAIK